MAAALEHTITANQAHHHPALNYHSPTKSMKYKRATTENVSTNLRSDAAWRLENLQKKTNPTVNLKYAAVLVVSSSYCDPP